MRNKSRRRAVTWSLRVSIFCNCCAVNATSVNASPAAIKMLRIAGNCSFAFALEYAPNRRAAAVEHKPPARTYHSPPRVMVSALSAAVSTLSSVSFAITDNGGSGGVKGGGLGGIGANGGVSTTMTGLVSTSIPRREEAPAAVWREASIRLETAAATSESAIAIAKSSWTLAALIVNETSDTGTPMLAAKVETSETRISVS